MYKGDTLCENCFSERKNSSSNYHEEKIEDRNWGVYFIPFIGLAVAIAESYKYGSRKILYHVYINGNHEKWTHHYEDKTNLLKCCKCKNFNDSLYHLDFIN